MRQRVSHYEIIEKLGEGGTGVVYKARDTKLDRLVALKFPSPQYLESADTTERFRQEARAISALNHPQVATIYQVDEDGGALFLVLEYLPGGTLRQRLRALAEAGQGLSIEQILHFALQVAEGLACAHRHQVLHRDVKSDNLMFTAEGALKITDFSLARHAGGGGQTLTGQVAGTVAYMSPEQAQGLHLDDQTDIYSFGVVLFEMITGRLPFEGTSVVEVLDCVIHRPAPALRDMRPDVPPQLEEVVAKAMAKDPAQRYQRMTDLAADLRRLRSLFKAGSDEGVTTVEAAPVTGTRTRAVAASLARAAARARRHRPLLAGGVAAALVVTTAGYRLGVGAWPWAPILPVERQLAVLPFENLGGAGDQAFCDGLAVTLTTKLTQLERFRGTLRVVPMTEVHKEDIHSAAQARRRFGVALVLTGSVQRDADRVRLTINLVDAASLSQLRGETIDTRLEDVFELQDGVATRIADWLGVTVPPTAQPQLRAGQTAVGAAFELYLTGLGKLARFDQGDSVDLAIRYFQQAFQSDPNYALAHAALGESYWRKYQASKDPQWIEEAKKSCARAVAINSNLAAVHVTLGIIHAGTGGYEPAIAAFQRALELDPVNASALRELARAYERAGRRAEAERSFQQAVRLHPTYWAGFNDLGGYYIRNGQYGEAERCYLHVIALTPDNQLAYRNLAGLYALMDRYDEAAVQARQSLAIRPTAQAYSNLGVIQFYLGDYAEAARVFEQAIRLEEQDWRLWGNLGDALRWNPGQEGGAPAAYHEAIRLADLVLKVDPRDAEACASVAVYCAGLGDRARALEHIAKARQLQSENRNVLFWAALVYELTGDRSQALEALRAAVHGGYSLAEVRRHPDLARLRQDPGYSALVAARNTTNQ